MCGLLALLCDPARSVTDDLVDAVAGASHLMRHRGPDEPGTWSDDRAVLGFNRLSIIDIAHSHQPLRWGPADAPDRYVLVFNGEIYNYLELRAALRTEFGAVFATEGDGEAIVAAYHHWGPEAALTRLRGMFAFAIWDTVAGELFCARDPFGIKPLFMATGPGGTVVGSEKKCLLELAGPLGIDLTIDRVPCSTTRCCSTCPNPRRCTSVCADSSRAAMPGRRPARSPVVTRYFVPRFTAVPFPAGSAPGREQDRYDEITAVLEDSVAKHMRADVTVGAFLSGGIDSTAIAALAIRHNPKLITFTTGFEREGFSEVDVADRLGRGDRRPARVEGGQPGRVRGRTARDRLVSRRAGGRPGAGAAVLHRPRGPQARQGGALRRGRRRAVRRLHHLPGTVVAEGVRLPSPPAATLAGSGVAAAAGGHARQEPAAPRFADARAALLRQRPQLLRRPVARGAARLPRRTGRTPT